MRDKSLFYAILYSCNRSEPQIITIGSNLDELKSEIVSILNVDLGIFDTHTYNILMYDQLSDDEKKEMDDEIISPPQISDMQHEHITSIIMSKEQVEDICKNYTGMLCCACSNCSGYISIFKTSHSCINFLNVMNNFSNN